MRFSHVPIRMVLFVVYFLSSVLLYAAGNTEVEGSLGFFSRYIWRGNQLSEGAVIQPSTTLKYKGFSVNLWGNYDINQRRLNEIDITAFISKSIVLWEVETGISHYYVLNGNDTTELYGGVCWNGLMKPSFKLCVDPDRGKGALLQFSLAHEQNIFPQIKTVVTGLANYSIRDAFLGTNRAGRPFSNWYNGELSAGLIVDLAKRGELRSVAGITFPLSRNADDALSNQNINGHSVQWYTGVTATVRF